LPISAPPGRQNNQTQWIQNLLKGDCQIPVLARIWQSGPSKIESTETKNPLNPQGELKMKFLASNRMKQVPNEEVMALFPAEQARVAELLAQGVLQNLYVAADFSKAWLVLQGESLAVAQKAVESLPLHKYSDVEITPLFE
jgi:muconolactone delta-isomerase